MAKGVARGTAPQIVNILKEIWPYIDHCLAYANTRPLPIKIPGYTPVGG